MTVIFLLEYQCAYVPIYHKWRGGRSRCLCSKRAVQSSLYFALSPFSLSQGVLILHSLFWRRTWDSIIRKARLLIAKVESADMRLPSSNDRVHLMQPSETPTMTDPCFHVCIHPFQKSPVTHPCSLSPLPINLVTLCKFLSSLSASVSLSLNEEMNSTNSNTNKIS